MKKIFLFCMAFLAMSTYTIAQVQSQKDIIKERKATAKLSRSELSEKASKVARKEAKKYVKEGWETSPGTLPIEKQLDKAYNMQYEYDETGFPKFLMGEAMSIGENYDAAKMQALELAKQNLAGQIQTEITELIENQVSNRQLSANQAVSVTQSVSASKNLISQSIGRIIPVVEIYRTKANSNKEVLVRVAYNSTMALEAAKKGLRQTLEEKGDSLQYQIDKILDLNK
ncbi:MAG: hypothetical protein KA955_10565 [Prevotella sp.]|nr:hypothetical protein [Prevotella sp.]